MKIRLMLSLFALFVIVSPEMAGAQEAPPAPPAVVAAPSAAQAPAAPTIAAFFGDDNFLGVHVEEVTRENMGGYGLSGEPRGVAVTRVVKDSPAERAGLRERDVIVRYDGEQVTSVRKLNRLIDESAPEHGARLTIRRGGSEQELTVKLGRRENFMRTFEGLDAWPVQGDMMLQGDLLRRRGEEARAQGEEARRRADELRKNFEEMGRANPGGVYSFSLGANRRIGLSTSTLGKQLADYFGVSHGTLVNSVEENSPASKAGLKAGDIITEADGERLEDAGDLSRIINRKEDGEVTLNVVRDRQRRTVKVTPERRQPQTFQLNPRAYVAPRIATAPRAPRAPRAITPSVRPARAIAAPRPIRMRPERVL